MKSHQIVLQEHQLVLTCANTASWRLFVRLQAQEGGTSNGFSGLYTQTEIIYLIPEQT